MQAVMRIEQELGYQPKDISLEKRGYDIESLDPESGRLRFIEVKGRAPKAPTITITKNEILTGLNKPDEFILAIVEVDGDHTQPWYIRHPFQREPDFAVSSVNYEMKKLLKIAEEPN